MHAPRERIKSKGDIVRTGRPPKPVHLKLLEGNAGRRPIPTPMPGLAEMDLTPPDILDDLAREHWLEVAPQAISSGILKNLDRTAFAVHCQIYSRWIKAELSIAEMDRLEKPEIEKFNRENDKKKLENRKPKRVRTHGLLIQGERGRAVQSPMARLAQISMEMYFRSAHQFGLTPVSRNSINAEEPQTNNPFAEIRDR